MIALYITGGILLLLILLLFIKISVFFSYYGKVPELKIKIGFISLGYNLKELKKEAEEVAKKSGSSIVLCVDADIMAPGAGEENKWLYGGDIATLFTEKVMVQLGEDSSVWKNRVEMIDEVTDSKLLAMVPAYAGDGMLVDTDKVISAISRTSAVGYALYSPNGYYKFS